MSNKVLIMASTYPRGDPFSGIFYSLSGIFYEDQALALSKLYEVMIFITRFSDTKNFWPPQNIFHPKFEERKGIPVLSYNFFIPSLLAIYFNEYFIQTAINGFEKIIQRWGMPDIIHAHNVFPAGWLAMNIGRKYTIPVVITEHTHFSFYLQTEGMRRIVQKTLCGVKQILPVGPALATDIQSFAPNAHVKVLGNLIPSEFISSSISPKETGSRPFRFITVAVLTKDKGIQHLLQAILLLIEKRIDSFEVLIGGDGPYKAQLESLARKLGIYDKCHFLGYLTRIEMKHWLDKSDVFVLPSLSETFSLVLCEAMARGKPVISTRCGGPEYIVTPETGVLVDVADNYGLSIAMENFIQGNNKFDSEQIMDNVTNRFGENAFLRNISEIYKDIW